MSRLKNTMLKFLLGAAGTLAIAGAPAASQAATVEIVGLDFESGKEAILAAGEVRGKPQTLLSDLTRGSLDVLIDECGSIYAVRDDKRTVELRHPEAVVQGLRMVVDHQQLYPMTFFENGQAYDQQPLAKSGYDNDSWDRKKENFAHEYNPFGTPVAGWPPGKRVVAAGRYPIGTGVGARVFVVDDEGTLFGVWSDSLGPVELKAIGDKGAHDGTISLVVGKGKIFTLRKNGHIFTTDLGQSGWGEVGVSPRRLGTENYLGAKALHIPSQSTLVAISEAVHGEAYLVDARDGSLMSRHTLAGLASAGAADVIEVKDRFDHRVQYDVAFARVSGDIGVCIDKQQLLADLAKQKKNTASRVEKAKEAFVALGKSFEKHQSALSEVKNQSVTLDEAKHMINKSTLEDRVADISGQVEELGEAFDEFEESHLTPLLEEKQAFLEAYGTPGGKLASEIESSGCCRGGTLGQIDDLASSLERMRRERANSAVEYLRSVFSGNGNEPMRAYYRPALSKKEMKSFEKDAKNRRALYERAREVAEQIGEEIAGDAPSVASFLEDSEAWFGRLDEALASSREKGAAENAKAVWPSRLAGFQGPGDPSELEKVALGFVQAETGDPYFEAHVCKGWQPIQRDSLGRVKDYAISMCMVRVDKEDPDFARTTWVVLYTVGPEMAPPFSHIAITEKSRIAMERRDGGAPDLADVPGFVPSGGGGPGGGWPGTFLRILTGLALLGTGSILAGKTLAGRVPSLQPIVESLDKHAHSLGRFAFGVGVVGLVAAILTLSPVANTLPIAGCLVTGLLIWRPSMESLKAEALPEQVRVGVERVLGLLPILAVRGESLGRVALALAPIHLLLGGLPIV